MEKKTEIMIKQDSPAGVAENLLRTAIDKNLPVEAMEKLLSMRQELKREWAREQFYQSLSALQAELPEIKKDKVVVGKDGKVRYRYASLDQIVKQVKDLLAKHGFSYTFVATYEPGAVVVRCIASHLAGHQESAEFRATIERDAFMGEIQKIGSALTYGKRYSFCSVFGIMTADEDTDAEPEDTEVHHPKSPESGHPQSEGIFATEAQLKKLHVLFEKLGIVATEDRLAYVKKALGITVKSSRELTKKQASMLIDLLEGGTNEDYK
jgi:hypothetical protein